MGLVTAHVKVIDDVVTRLLIGRVPHTLAQQANVAKLADIEELVLVHDCANPLPRRGILLDDLEVGFPPGDREKDARAGLRVNRHF